MTSGIHGADVAALRQFSERIARGGETLDGVVRIIETAMPVPEQWHGADAETFRDEWYGSHSPSLTGLAQTLAQIADVVRGHADGQEGTSDNLAGGGIGVPGEHGIGVAPELGIGVPGERGIGVNAEEPAVFYGEEPSLFEELLSGLGLLSTFEGIAGTLLENIKALGFDVNQFGKGFGAVFNVVSIVTSGHQYFGSLSDFIGSGDPNDLYTAGDGYVSMVLAAGSFIPVVGLGFGIAGGAWGLSTLGNSQVSDRPLTQNLIDNGAAGMLFEHYSDSDEQLSEVLADGYHDALMEQFAITNDVVDGVQSAADTVADTAGSAADAIGDTASDILEGGSDLLDGAGDLLNF